MKKIGKIFLTLVVFLSFSTLINAACKNDELNEWATTVEAKFYEITDIGINDEEYAYLLSITPLRDDVTIKAYDVNGKSAVGTMLVPAKGEKAIQAVGCYTNLEEETYTIEIYGAKNSACSGELLKTLKYTVPRVNRFIKDARCENSDSEYCKTFTNSTKDMTQEDFDKVMKKETSSGWDISFSNILKVLGSYGLYILIPLIIISVFYAIKINKYKKEERDR